MVKRSRDSFVVKRFDGLDCITQFFSGYEALCYVIEGLESSQEIFKSFTR
jgi:hypothetical protein